MKSFVKKTIASISLAGLLFSGVAMAEPGWQGKPKHHRGGPYFHQMGGGMMGGIPGLQLRDEMYSARIEALAELAKQPVKTIQTKIQTKPFPSIMEEYKVEPEALQAKMKEKMPQVLKKATAAGKITAEQEKLLLERMEKAYARAGKGHGKRGSERNCQ
ncbi:MAG: hypothetical protein HQM14_02840 [SAR324 cluster bacterium]|nr:hypothetical protein [SAR324 cluster bacterium]